MDSAFTVPIYEPAPYNFSGRSLQELPLLARYYLADVAQILPPATSRPGSIEDRHAELALALFRSLKGTDIAMVELRRLARTMSPRQPMESMEDWHQRIMDLDIDRLRQVVGILLPERQTVMDEFMIKFDALLWVEMEGQGWSIQEQQEHRDRLCTPILEYTNQALLTLDEAVMKRTLAEQQQTSLLENWPEKSPAMEGSEEASPVQTPRVLLPRRSDAPIAVSQETQTIASTQSLSFEHVQMRLRFIRDIHGKFTQRVVLEEGNSRTHAGG